MHARQIAPIVRERYERVLIGDIPEIHAEILLAGEQFSQLRNRESVTRVHADNRRAAREKLVDLRFQFLRKILELRSKTRLEPLPRPDEFVAERGQAGSASPLAFHQRHFKKGRPLLDQIPGVPIRQARPIGGAADFSGHADFVQEVQHHQVGRWIALPLETPHRFDFDSDQYGLQYIFQIWNRQ